MLTMNAVVSPAAVSAAPVATSAAVVTAEVVRTITPSPVVQPDRLQLQHSLDAVNALTQTFLDRFVDYFGTRYAVLRVPPHINYGNTGAIAELYVPGVGDVVVAAPKGGEAVYLTGGTLAKWKSLGGESSAIGFPLPQQGFLDVVGPFTRFEHGIIVRTDTGYVAVSAVTTYILFEGLRPRSLGAPTADTDYLPDGGTVDHFAKGAIYTGPKGSGVGGVLTGGYVAAYERLGGPGGWLGYPVGAPVLGTDGVTTTVRFQHGQLRWNPTTGFVAVRYDVWDAVRLDLWG
ncbi:MAG: hypothetical protein U0871_15160 [Gemmataceae bacterium]